MTHLFRMHGFSSRPGLNMTLQELKDLHETMHIDDYALPPHSHPAGEVKLTLGEFYIEGLIARMRSDV